jgi:hypothetical protein
MPANTSPLSFEGLREVLDRAVASEKGVKIIFSSGTEEQNEAQAIYQRARMHKLRTNDRARSLEVYPPDHPLRGQSPWDGLIINKVKNGEAYELHIVKSALSNFVVEEL